MKQASTFLGKLARNSAGNVLALSAAALIPILLLVGSAVDMGIAYTTRAKLQNACDAGVLAARQSMSGAKFKTKNKKEGQEFFDFNFPADTHNAKDIVFDVKQNASDSLELNATASLNLPMPIMHIFGFDAIPISVECFAKRDQADNDIVLVLDVTGSMADSPSGGGTSKIASLRTGASGLYRALEGDTLSTTRFGIVPYSHTVNVARSLKNRDFLRNQEYVDYDGYTVSSKTVHINKSSWNYATSGTAAGNIQAFRTSGNGCIEERSSSSETGNSVKYSDSISVADVEGVPANGSDKKLQFGRYDPASHTHSASGTSGGVLFYNIADRWIQTGCPSEATTLREYGDETAFNTAISSATARVTGGTYHDIGMLWGLRFISREGFFKSDNPTERGNVPVRQHIIFMTDGKLDTGSTLYSAFGIESLQGRTGSSDLDQTHIDRFASACNVAKSLGVTVWVIALDVTDTADIKPCATTEGHFYISDGSDLEDVFAAIGNGIGYLRLTR